MYQSLQNMGKINNTLLVFLLILGFSCRQREKPMVIIQDQQQESVSELKDRLTDLGYSVFDYVDETTGDTIIMQKYFIAFLKKGPNRNQSQQVAEQLQLRHRAHLQRMYELGYADISGPFDDDGAIMGITVYNTPDMRTADSLANLDPMVKAGRLVIEMHPWWAAKGFSLR